MNYFIAVLKKYADFSGRARRKEYWMFFLFYVIIYIVLSILDSMLFGNGKPILGFIFLLGIIVPSIAVAVRRMHDVGKSGWYMFIPIYSLILAITEGENGSNKYGPNPKNPEMENSDHLVE